MNTKFVVEPVWSWPVVAIVAFGLLALVLLTYPPRVRHLATFPRRFLIGTRLAAAVLLILAMLRPEVQFTKHNSKSAVMFVVGDTSRSMGTKDAANGISRRESVVKLLQDRGETLEQIGKLVETRFFDFDRELRPVELPGLSLNTDGEMTAIGASLEPLLKEAQNKRVVGILLLTDGAHRSVPPYDADPRTIARRLGQQQMPVFPVLIGESTLTDTAFDLSVEDLVVSPIVFEKNTVPVQAKIRLAGAAGRQVSVRLLIEDRSGTLGQTGELVAPRATNGARPATVVQTGQNNAVVPVELSFVPELPGEFKIAVQVIPAEGELKTTNNQRETLITVQRGGVNVAYFDSAREEQKFLRTVNQAQQIQLDFHWVRSGSFARLTRIDPQWFQPGRYDVFIIGDVLANVFGDDVLRQLSRRVDEGAGLMMIGGLHSFGLGGYASTPLADVLPVAMSPQELQAPGEIATDLHYSQDLQMLPTEAGLRHFVMRLTSENNAERWRQLPALRGANKLRLKNDLAQILATGGDDNIPLLFSLEVGRARVLAFAGDTTFRWATGEKPFVDEHQRFWRQIILWLARKEFESEQPVWVKVDPRNFSPGAQVQFEFGAQDSDGNPLADVEFQAKITAPDGKSHEVPAQRTGERSFARFEQSHTPGTYRISVSGTRDGQPYGDAGTRFLIDERDLELDNPAADPELLKEIAALTGGRMLTSAQLGEFFDDFLKHGPPSLDDVQITRLSLWDNWWFLAAFVVLMSAEWFVRKRRGLV